MKHIRVLLVDDQPAIRQGLCLRMATESDIVVIGEAADGASALSLAQALTPNVVVMDIRMPGIDGIEATKILTSITPDIKIVILSLHDDPRTQSRATDAGAAAFVAKHQADPLLLDTIRRVVMAKPTHIRSP